MSVSCKEEDTCLQLRIDAVTFQQTTAQVLIVECLDLRGKRRNWSRGLVDCSLYAITVVFRHIESGRYTHTYE